MLKKIIYKKSPMLSRGFFLLIVLIDFFMLFFLSSNIFLLIEFVLFQLGYFFYMKGTLRKIFSILIIALLIFIFNIFQVTGGQTLFANDLIILTTQSLHVGLEKALLLLGLFFVSSNCIYQNRYIFFPSNSSSLFSLSVQKFFYLFERINLKNGKMLKNVYLWFYRSLLSYPVNNLKEKPSLKKFFYFHGIFFLFMFGSFFFSLKIN
jgi:hypothetical protein